jgi:hypothetical protein
MNKGAKAYNPTSNGESKAGWKDVVISTQISDKKIVAKHTKQQDNEGFKKLSFL